MRRKLLVLGWLWGCSTCPVTNCPNESFLLLSSGSCVTNVTSDCASQIVSCAEGVVSPPQTDSGSGTCTVAAALSDGTSLTFQVAFAYGGTDPCCGPRYAIDPPTLVVGRTGDGGVDAE